MRFIDTVIRLEHVPLNSSTGVAIEVWIQNLEYSDEAGLDPSNTSLDPDESAKGYIISAFSTKRFYMEGVTFHTDEFPSRARTFSRSMLASTCSTPDSKVNIKTCFSRCCNEEAILKDLISFHDETELGQSVHLRTNVSYAEHSAHSSGRECCQQLERIKSHHVC